VVDAQQAEDPHDARPNMDRRGNDARHAANRNGATAAVFEAAKPAPAALNCR
jgi:hypothetical protein